MEEKSVEKSPKAPEKEAEKGREKICISISEGYIRHHDEEPEIEEQFILRLPKSEANVLHAALAADNLDERFKIKMHDNLREADLQLDDSKMHGKLMDLPTIIESHKLVDDTTLYKTADIAQILICTKELSGASTSAAAAEIAKVEKQFKHNACKYPDGLTPPLKNVRKKRFRKVKLEENFDPNVDREVKRLLRADGAAESVSYQLIYEAEEDDVEAENEVNCGDGQVDDNDNDTNSYKSTKVDTSSIDGGGAADGVGSESGAGAFAIEPFVVGVEQKNFYYLSDSDSECGGIEEFDFDKLTDEEKQLRARLSEINFSLSNLTCKPSPPDITRTRGRGRGRGRPRIHKQDGDGDTPRLKPKPTIAVRGKRGRPPGRSRGILRGELHAYAMSSDASIMSTESN